MSQRKRWATKEAAKAFMNAYEKRVDVVVKKGEKRVVLEGPKGLTYWAAYDFVNK